jgi:hypothetical protein
MYTAPTNRPVRHHFRSNDVCMHCGAMHGRVDTGDHCLIGGRPLRDFRYAVEPSSEPDAAGRQMVSEDIEIDVRVGLAHLYPAAKYDADGLRVLAGRLLSAAAALDTPSGLAEGDEEVAPGPVAMQYRSDLCECVGGTSPNLCDSCIDERS